MPSSGKEPVIIVMVGLKEENILGFGECYLESSCGYLDSPTFFISNMFLRTPVVSWPEIPYILY